MSYAVVRTDNLTGTRDGARLVSFHFYSGNAKAAIENGNIVSIGALDEPGVYKATAPTAKQALGKLALVAGVELIYDNHTYRNLDDYINEAGKEVRGYVLHSGDVFSVTAEAPSAAPTDGTLGVEVQAGTKLKVVEALTDAVAEYLGSDTQNGYTYYKFRVI